jgi:hypothetical protein
MAKWKMYVIGPIRFEADRVEVVNTKQVLVDGKLLTFSDGYRGLQEEEEPVPQRVIL